MKRGGKNCYRYSVQCHNGQPCMIWRPQSQSCVAHCSRSVLCFEIVGRSVWIFIIVDVLSHLPHLQDVVFRHTADHPGLVRVPGKVRDLGCVSTMNKLKRGRKREDKSIVRSVQNITQLTTSSGGPSSASSGDCSSPILLKSQTWSLLSVPLDARMVSL